MKNAIDPPSSYAPRTRIRRRYAVAAFSILAALLAVDIWTRNHQTASPASSAARPASEKPESEEKGLETTVRMEAQAQKNIGLTTAPAAMRSIADNLQATGIVGANETRLAHIHALSRGRILAVHVRPGDRVSAGQPLADYDNIELGELIGQRGVNQAAFQKANADAEVAKRALERARNLVELGAVAQAEVDRRSAEYATTQAAIETQRAELAQIEQKMRRFGMTRPGGQGPAIGDNATLARTTITAPFSGTITQYNIAEGETVEVDRELFTLADLSTVWVQAEVYEKDIGLVRASSQVTVKVDAYPRETFVGKITYVSAMIDPKTRTAKVRCEVANSNDRLKLDMFATISIPTPAGHRALMVPASAIQQINSQPVVFVRTGEDTFERRQVELGAQGTDWLEILHGIKEGEAVVTQGSFELKATVLREQFGEKE